MISRVIAHCVVFVLFLLPFSSYAVDVPSKIVPCTGVDCTFCDLGQLAQNLLNTGIFVAVFLSAILFAYAGWLYVSSGVENVGDKTAGKKIFWNVGLGLTIIIGSWMFVDTLMKLLLKGEFGPWNDVCSGR